MYERPFTWIAIYDDGTQAWEADFSSIRNIPRPEHLAKLALVRRHDLHDPAGHFTVRLPQGAEPVCFSRNMIHVAMSDGEEAGRDAISVIGWRRDEQMMLLFVYADGSCAVFDRDPDEG